jgi:hypothetical protein
MKLEIGSYYKIVFEINNKILTFNCKIVSNEDDFITFVDKYGKELTYNISNIVSFEKVGDNDDRKI